MYELFTIFAVTTLGHKFDSDISSNKNDSVCFKRFYLHRCRQVDLATRL